jgi:hypothetical protein
MFYEWSSKFHRQRFLVLNIGVCDCVWWQKTAQTLILDVGEDRILLDTRSNVYHMDIYLPYNIVQEDVGAQFDRCTKVQL